MEIVDLAGEAAVAVLDYNTAKNMADVLHENYPGHLWAVTCEGEKGIATVRNLALSGEWGFVLHLKGFYSASSWAKDVVMAGGELLERFRLARGLANQEAIAAVPNDFSGRSIGDYAK